MTTTAQIMANRRNAMRSSGPRTALGRKTSSKNARRHGVKAAPPPDAILVHLRAILDDCEATPETALRTPAGTAALALAISEAKLDMAKAYAMEAAIRQPKQELRTEIEMLQDLLQEPEHKYDMKTQIVGQKLMIELTNSAEQVDNRALRSAQRYLREAEAARSTALKKFLAELLK